MIVLAINLKYEDPELESELSHFIADHKKEYPRQSAFIIAAIREKLEREKTGK